MPYHGVKIPNGGNHEIEIMYSNRKAKIQYQQ